MKRKVFILSDSTGDTAQKVIDAALKQFDNPLVQVEVFPRVRSEREIEDVVERAVEANAMLVHTIVNAHHREMLQHLCVDARLPDVDLIGSLVGKLGNFLVQEPRFKPGGAHLVDEAYYRRIAAVEFAVKNDDGQHPHNLYKATIVLVGISRTSKTPLSTYLAQRCHKVANVPIVMGIEPPPELFRIEQDNIFALQIDPEALFRIRQKRLESLGMPPDTAYGMQDHILQETNYANQLFAANPHWPVLDVTDRAIEETAAELLSLKKKREERAATPQ